MDRSELFTRFVNVCDKENQWVGQGNPLSDILIVGKEPAIQSDDDKKDIRDNIRWNLNGLESGKYHVVQVKRSDCKGGHTWQKYQTLIDYIYKGELSNSETLDFESRVLTTEANNTVSKRTFNAKKAFEERKKMFILSECDFIRNFPVTILACGNYYTNNDKIREIDTIYDVTFDVEGGERVMFSHKGKPYKFWIHHNADRSRLLIHTRQLSTDIPNDFLEAIAKEIKMHLGL